MLIPQFTLRKLLAMMAALSAFFLVLSFAVAGSKWAIALSVAVAWLVLMGVLYALAFAVVWIVSLVPLGAMGGRAPPVSSPFGPVRAVPAPATGAGESPFAPTSGGPS